ncbi:hypothetical protein HNQ07_003715 [Deinococcus metalli]|uniref:Uncharacterized protein n=1 Tax=Deinococcus metalli TaxID=1141878 RepID=A0A7W8NPQ4_9DEIO|nr:hypothetical protein [Deinococcus metalli]MBB5378214.1 hypothetical protein [Deinococcus metalli]GHF56884.1 hypothetical protein GCM10017781_36530 [Deinococcus metalli]
MKERDIGSQGAATVSTPLGELVLRASIHPATTPLDEFQPVPGTTFIRTTFEVAGARGELLLGTLDPGLLPGQTVDQCWGVIWTVQADFDLPQRQVLEFTCSLGEEPFWTETGWGSGQSVIYRSWEHELTQLVLGTIDPECGLSFYAEQQGFRLPLRRFAEHPAFFEFDCIESSASGLTVRYPALRVGEVCQAQFVAAWKDRRDLNDQDAVLAVDLAPIQIFRAASGKTIQ